ncbi:MAG: response regulator transcription factor [Alicyclobacillus mali]|uniref:response regulator n=1 Tax=Alicyclobacillus mali (ex Roth et al. 2021) TaxID=1123961 RepID=UPI0023F097BA|nr:response regulator transcription factor [Alicyclobacillus mali (ex Roth et al. 2021)]MCL6489763.1 response regulator transcription factor [Alicyclobacillus mali (ex Roth et al. 2021)]
MTQDRLSIAIADDQELVREGLALLLEQVDGFQVVGLARDGYEALALAGTVMPDLLLCDIRMPGLTGIEVARELKRAASTVRVVMLTTFDDLDFVEAALAAGACGFLLKGEPVDRMVESLRRMAHGEMIYATRHAQEAFRSVAGGLNSTGDHDGQELRASERQEHWLQAVAQDLTEREADVLRLMAEGLSNLEIARELGVSLGTVKTHVHRILAKLGIERRAQAVRLALEMRRGKEDG